jgi:4-amino-4-deoxy-L-arabinose transferase-like glycosyltransferase
MADDLSDRFKVGLVLIAVGALLLRVTYVVIEAGNVVGGDGRYYHLIAGLIADGKGFIVPKAYLNHGLVYPSATHPPAWPLTLAAAAVVGLRTTLEQQLFAGLIGTATVVVIAFAGRRLAGDLAGLAAAAIAAVYPNFWLYERELMSETLTLFGAALTVLLAYRFWDRPGRGRAAALGLSCGLLAMTHSEQILLVGALLVPLVLRARGTPLRRRFAWAGLATAAAITMMLPWAAYNTARFDTPVLLGTQFGINVAISNCAAAYSGANIGFKVPKCGDAAEAAGDITGDDDPSRDAQYLRVGLDYASAHLSRLPVVVAAREARTWGILPRQLRADSARGTVRPVIDLGFVAYWMLVPAAVAGVVILRRRRVTVLPLVGLAVSVTIGVALTFGFTRFRAAAEVAIVLLAAVTVDAVLRTRMASSSPAEREQQEGVDEHGFASE